MHTQLLWDVITLLHISNKNRSVPKCSKTILTKVCICTTLD